MKSIHPLSKQQALYVKQKYVKFLKTINLMLDLGNMSVATNKTQKTSAKNGWLKVMSELLKFEYLICIENLFISSNL